MSIIDTVRSEMMAAMKAKDKTKKDALSSLLSALKAKSIELKGDRGDLPEDVALAVIAKEIKALKETVETAPRGYEDTIAECKAKIEILSQFMPKQMSEDEIRETIKGVLAQLGIDAPTAKQKGIIMKVLMPLTKGKADGKVVNDVLASLFTE